jgi:hypothetical protein
MTDHSLIAAYRNTDFIIDAPDGQLVRRLGRPNQQPNQQIDALLRVDGFSDCACITASNPKSVWLRPAENARRHSALMERVRKLGYPSADEFLFTPTWIQPVMDGLSKVVSDNPLCLHSLLPYPRTCRTVLCRQAVQAKPAIA